MKRVLLNLLAVLLGVSVACALGELAVRVFDLPPRLLATLSYQNFSLSDNPILRYEYRRGYDGPIADRASLFHINVNGFRDRVYPTTKPDGVTRIILLGDSICAGNGVIDLEKTFAKHIERQLNADTDTRRIEVLNMAVGGYNTMQEAEFLRVRGLAYNPDVVAICFCINDFTWTSDGSVLKKLKEQITEQGAGNFARIASTPDSWMTWILRHSRFAFATYSVGAGLLDLGTHRVVIGDYEAISDNPVGIGMQLLRRLQEEHGFRVILFIIPGLNKPFSRYEHTSIHERVRTTAAETFPSLTMVDLLDSMGKAMDDPAKLTYDGLHLTEEGHRVVADHMSAALTGFLSNR